MKPYYDDGRIVIYNGDCREVETVGWADCGIADPPYGETSLSWDRWPLGWPAAVFDAIKSNGSLWCFGSLRMFLDRRDEFARWKLSHEVIWEKHNGSGFLTDRFRRVHELAAHFYPAETKWADVYKSPRFTMDATARTVRKKEKPAQWHGKTGSTTYVSQDGGPRMMRSVLQVRSCHGSALNETQKPLGIIRPLLEYAPARRNGVRSVRRFRQRLDRCERARAQSDWFRRPRRPMRDCRKATRAGRDVHGRRSMTHQTTCTKCGQVVIREVSPFRMHDRVRLSAAGRQRFSRYVHDRLGTVRSLGRSAYGVTVVWDGCRSQQFYRCALIERAKAATSSTTQTTSAA